MQLDEYIAIEQSKALSRLTPATLLSTLLASVITVGVLSSHFSMLTLWFFVICLLVICRWLMSQKHTPEHINKFNHHKNLKLLTFWSIISGLNWGAAAFLFYDPNAPIYTVYLVCIQAGYITAAVASSALFMPAFLGLSVSGLGLFFIRYVTSPDTFHALLGFSIPCFLIVMTVFARVANANFKAAKKLEFDNARLLDEITTQKTLAETAVIEKNQFLAATSHDLRQPLHAIGLYIDALKPRLSGSLDQDILNKMAQSGSALNDLLYGLLDISRLDAGVVENRPRHFHLQRIVKELTAEFDSQASKEGLDLDIQIDQQQVVFVDPILLERVLRNLLSNAIKYTEIGYVKLSTVAVNGVLEIKVADSGIGVAEKDVQSIFSEFTQLGNPERDRNKGLGLGLAIVKRLCTLQEIPYQFSSELDKGTIVTLSVPQGDPALSVLDRVTESSKHLTILFIDDEEAIRDSMKMVISSWQCIPLIASDKAQAMAIVQSLEHDIDIIISDLRLRENLTGIELIKEIREELNQDIPAIIVTGDTAVERLELTSLADVVLMHKPIKPADLRQQIENYVNR